jgi:hypothetical protein
MFLAFYMIETKSIYSKQDIKPIKLQWNLSKPNPAYTKILDKLNCK